MRLSTLVLALGLLSAPAFAQRSTPVEDTIRAQIEAFRAGDVEAAFSHAADTIRAAFITPDAFGRMVAQGYPMVVDPAEIRFLDQSTRAGIIVQRVLLTDRQGQVFLLEYQMTDAGAAPRIRGVRILPQTGQGV